MKFLKDMIKQKAEAVHCPQPDHPENDALQLRDWRIEPAPDAPLAEVDNTQNPFDPDTPALDGQCAPPPSDDLHTAVSAMMESDRQGTEPDPWATVDDPSGWDDSEPNLPEVSPPLQNIFARDPQPRQDPPPATPDHPGHAAPAPAAAPVSSAFVPPTGQGVARAGRIKTRILGFSTGMGGAADPFDATPNPEGDTQPGFPVGWLVVTHGPGRGASFALFAGVAQIGRGTGQTIRLDFGDTAISRENHAAIAYDAELNSFYLGHGGKANIVRCNNRPVLSTQELEPGDSIRIGETTLRFVPLCGPGFQWDDSDTPEMPHAARG